MESPTLAARHDFDTLSTTSRIEVRPAKHVEIPDIALMARTIVPGVHISEQALLQHYLHDGECILMFAWEGRLLGGMAFLYLSERGLEALMSGELTPTHPDFELLARGDGGG